MIGLYLFQGIIILGFLFGLYQIRKDKKDNKPWDKASKEALYFYFSLIEVGLILIYLFVPPSI